ncbi:hypothetical protein OF363_02280 [Mycoplasma enhydrae]|uniref:hypothetical protein n=1 Tax=Mycoplasma enhydrae TaxID=2499220 RepID=UPI0021E7985D|nr:hypothetical protein [Mycoplasma enhydrae]MCV3733854.1 hypothetical protein [Mycoplasma enhydrae]
MNKNFATSKARAYWNNSWTKTTIIYFFVSLFIMLLFILLIGFFGKETLKKMNWSNGITVGTVLVLAVSLMVIAFRKGLGKGIIKTFSTYVHNAKISSRAKKKYTPYMTQHEKDRILNKERQAYNNEKTKKLLKKNLEETTNLSSYLLILISSVILISGLLAIHLG